VQHRVMERVLEQAGRVMELVQEQAGRVRRVVNQRRRPIVVQCPSRGLLLEHGPPVSLG
jgi:hypothetical protein